MMKANRTRITPRKSLDPELEALFRPGQVFDHPDQVVDDPDLTLNEKRTILASWASDACAIEAAPALRRVPGSGQVVKIDEILEALRRLDKEAGRRRSILVPAPGSAQVHRNLPRKPQSPRRQDGQGASELGPDNRKQVRRRTAECEKTLNGRIWVLSFCSGSANKEASS